MWYSDIFEQNVNQGYLGTEYSYTLYAIVIRIMFRKERTAL